MKIMKPRTLLALLLVLAATAGCSHGSFDRFMDHPILSWLPLDKWGLVEGGSAPTRTAQFPDKDCFGLARERTEYLDKSEYDDADLRKIFALTYQDCVWIKR